MGTQALYSNKRNFYLAVSCGNKRTKANAEGGKQGKHLELPRCAHVSVMCVCVGDVCAHVSVISVCMYVCVHGLHCAPNQARNFFAHTAHPGTLLRVPNQTRNFIAHTIHPGTSLRLSGEGAACAAPPRSSMHSTAGCRMPQPAAWRWHPR